MNNKKMVITDLDGTLLREDKTVSSVDLNTLKNLRDKGVICAIATGRSLYSLKKVINDEFPVDYCIFSSGAGIMNWETKELISSHNMEKEYVHIVYDKLIELSLDFMVHSPIPDNHYFYYIQVTKNNSDFNNRCALYKDFCFPVKKELTLNSACHFIVIDPRNKAVDIYDTLKKELKDLKVIMTTSPLDGYSTWIEIFSLKVSKAIAGEYVSELESILVNDILAVGNDYNDIDLLTWAGKSYVVDNAPNDLKQTFQAVKNHNKNGFTDAVIMGI